MGEGGDIVGDKGALGRGEALGGTSAKIATLYAYLGLERFGLGLHWVQIRLTPNKSKAFLCTGVGSVTLSKSK